MTRQEALAIAKPILFVTPMVQAILDNRKTVTRRVIKLPQCGYFENDPPRVKLPYKVGDILYVRETGLIQSMKAFGNKVKMLFKADDSLVEFSVSEKEYKRLSKWAYFQKWLSPYWLTKEIARIFLRVTAVNAERLQDITEEQAKREGIKGYLAPPHDNMAFVGCEMNTYDTRVKAFLHIWDSTIKKADLDTYGWNANPWVFVIEFERVTVE